MSNPIFFGTRSPIFFEEWKPVNDNRVKPMYEVNNFGDIKNINSGKILHSRAIKVSKKHGTKPYQGYSLISKTGNPKYISKTKHRTVLEAFNPISNMSEMSINHKNGDKENCELPNLEWDEQWKNNLQARIRGLNKNYGSNQHLAKLNEDQVKEICKYLEQGLRYSKILELIGFDNTDNNRDMIGNIKRRISWKQISYKYKF